MSYYAFKNNKTDISIMKRENPFIEAFDETNKLQDLYDNLPTELKQSIKRNVNINRKQAGTALSIIGFLGCISDNAETQRFGKQALGAGTSLFLRS